MSLHPDLHGPPSLTLIGSLLLAVGLLVVRIALMQRVQRSRQRENRQETERLKSLVAAYRALAGSFTPVEASTLGQHAPRLEEALADLVLFGSVRQVEAAARIAARLRRGEAVDTQPLIEDLRADLRRQLGLEPIPASVGIPDSGPSRNARGGGEAGEARAGANRGGGGGGGGADAGFGAVVGSGVVAAHARTHNPAEGEDGESGPGALRDV